MGMKEHEYQDAMREIGFYFLGAPATILIGMYVIGAIIDAFTGASGTFSKIFLYIGGIPGVAVYYYDRFIGFKKRARRDYDKK
ncbi:MAG: hypothetical protein P8X70_00495 [Nanoarchaeota archaeon]